MAPLVSRSYVVQSYYAKQPLAAQVSLETGHLLGMGLNLLCI
jgi:hypothetical protein